MKKLRALFRKTWDFIGDDRLYMVLGGIGMADGWRQYGTGDAWGLAWFIFCLTLTALCWRDIGKAMRK